MSKVDNLAKENWQKKKEDRAQSHDDDENFA